MKKLFLFLLCIAGTHFAGAQEVISGVVLNSYDSSKVPFARVSVAGQKAQITTNANGQFSVPANLAAGRLQIRVAALGIDTVFSFAAPFPKSFVLRVVPKGFEIGTTTIRGLSAKEVVKEAIKRIPQNYATEGYLYYGFYRQYHRKDSAFQNLVEARVATLVQPKIVGRQLEAEYRFLPLAMRRQTYKKLPIEGSNEADGIVEEVFGVDPVYFQDTGPFISSVFNGTVFRFDTAINDQGSYVIKYQSNSSSEDHGFVYTVGNLTGESYAVGKLIIDRKSFAFINIERKTFRNKWYNYPYHNNFILPNLLHVEEFLEGHLDIWYKRHKDHWVLARLRHGFTNDFFKTTKLNLSGGHECLLGQFYEWKTDSVSRYVPGEMLPLFYKEPYLQFVEMPKDTIPPNSTPPFFFHPKQQVYKAVGWNE